jgi:hypothetical protein
MEISIELERICTDRAIRKVINIQNNIKIYGIICFVLLFICIAIPYSVYESKKIKIIIICFAMILYCLWGICRYKYWKYGEYSLTQMFYTYYLQNY